jgi:flagellar hook-associated protein 2
MVPATGTTAVVKYTTFTASIADTTIASASASTGAVAGSYSLEISALAKSQRLVTPAYVGGSAATVIATGSLLIEFGKLDGGVYTGDSLRSKTITIDSSNATLGGLRDAINAANIGASATIVNGTGGAQLVLSSNETGLSNVIRLSGLTAFDYNPVANTGTMTQAALQGGQAATNAAFTLNGIAATSSTNTVTGVLDGVTLNLLKTTAALTPTTLKVSKDSIGSLTSSLNAFVKAYNDANKAMSELGAYNATTKAAGALQGSSTLRTAKNQMRSLVFNATAGGTSPYQHLSNIGVSLGKDGSLSLDSAKLTAAVAADPTSVANLVSAVGSAYKTGIEGLVGSTGSITAATDGANRTIKDLTKRQQALSDRLTVIQANYTKQFTALDSLIAGMKQTSSYLSQQLANLPGVTSTN